MVTVDWMPVQHLRGVQQSLNVHIHSVEVVREELMRFIWITKSLGLEVCTHYITKSAKGDVP
jgi:hypothetical protein